MKLLALLLLLLASGASAQTFSASASCRSFSRSKTWQEGISGIAEAFANTRAVGCSGNFPADRLWNRIRRRQMAWAHAMVEVQTKAYATCHTTGQAFGCAEANAYAQGRQREIADAIAGATAEAINKCRRCKNRAEALSHVSAEVFVDIIAKAKARVEANVCVGPNQSASALSYANCVADIYAEGVATAFSKALIAGECVRNHAELKAWTITDADAVVEVNPECSCLGVARVCAGAGNQCWWRRKEINMSDAMWAQKSVPLKRKYPTAFARFNARCRAAARQVN